MLWLRQRKSLLGVKELAEADDRFVSTVGQLNVATQNAVNIVPGKVQLAIETRAADDRVFSRGSCKDHEFTRADGE